MSGTKRSYIFSFSVQCHDDSTVFFGKYAEILPGLEPPYFILVFMTSQSLYLSRACDVYWLVLVPLYNDVEIKINE